MLGAGVGLMAAAAVVVVRASGLLTGWVARGYALVVEPLLPTARALSQRVVVTGALAVGVTPILWWARVPVPGLRATLLLALATGGLLAWVVAGRRAGLRR